MRILHQILTKYTFLHLKFDSTCLPFKILITYTLLLGYLYAIHHSFLQKMSCFRPKNKVILIEPKGRVHYSTNRSRGLKKD